jgi:hypothetical protein
VIVAPFARLTIFMLGISSRGSNPAGSINRGKWRMMIRIFSKMLSGSPILSTNCSLREPQPMAAPGRYSHNHIENAQPSHVAPISRAFSINPLCCPSTQACRNAIISAWRGKGTNGITVGASLAALRGS